MHEIPAAEAKRNEALLHEGELTLPKVTARDASREIRGP